MPRTFQKSALLGTANILRKMLNFQYEVIDLIERTIYDKSSNTNVYCYNNNNNNNNSNDEDDDDNDNIFIFKQDL